MPKQTYEYRAEEVPVRADGLSTSALSFQFDIVELITHT